MAENKKSIILYTDLIHTIRMLTDVQRGQLMLTIFEYVNDLNPVITDPIIKIAFEPIKHQLKRDLKKYESKKKQWSEAGKASAEARKRKIKQASTDVDDSKKRSTVSTVTVNDSVNDNATVNVNDINNIYSLYPAKCPIKNSSTGKSSKDKNKIERLLKKYTVEELEKTINRYVKECVETKTYMKNFSTFLNNLPDYSEEEKPKQKPTRFQCKKHACPTKIFECGTEDEASKMYYNWGGVYPESIIKL